MNFLFIALFLAFINIIGKNLRAENLKRWFGKFNRKVSCAMKMFYAGVKRNGKWENYNS